MPGRTGRNCGRGQGPHGFSLIELLIVVAIILVIVAIAIPNFMRSRMAANESATVQNVRAVVTANVVYSSTYGIGYSSDLLSLGPNPGGGPASPSNAGLIDDVLATGVKSGYAFTYTASAPVAGNLIPAYALTADPVTPGYTGNRHFFTDDSGVIRQNLSVTATVSDTPIG
ncbi:MAG TPA: prepilin-type N-terminal cleavage/methylation domain-containing protein [Candidatus Binatia bacterium]|nr:prepilin-type N-terminal cleavage/methylation domain-containing protein [Candidatus Binatia bacterium]